MLEIICATQIALSIATEKAMQTAALADNIARASAIQNSVVLDKQQTIAGKLYASDYRREADTRDRDRDRDRDRSDEYRRDRDDRDRDSEDRDSEDSEVKSDYQKAADEASEIRPDSQNEEDSDRYEDDVENRRDAREEDDDLDRDSGTEESQSLEELLDDWFSN